MQQRFKFTLLIIFYLAFVGCNFPLIRLGKTLETPQVPGSLGKTYPVAPIFMKFYNSLGGEKLLGPAISPLIESGQIQSQFVEAALLTYDPSGRNGGEFSLAPLGVMLGISEPPIEKPDSKDSLYINGHFIYPEFLQFFEQLGGIDVVGRPLTEAHHNPERNRIEQYFENLGLYRFTFDPPGTVRLLAYGAYVCDFACNYSPSSASIPSIQGLLPQPFSQEAARLGIGVTGLTLAGPHLATDGKLEVIFENVVMVLENERRRSAYELTFQIWLPEILSGRPGNPFGFAHRSWLPFVIDLGTNLEESSQDEVIELLFGPIIVKSAPKLKPYVSLRPIARMIGIIPDTPVEKGDYPLMVFYEIRGGKGYHVPNLFAQFFTRYGGFRFSGSPITEPFLLEGGIFRQCFENLCLDFNVQGQTPHLKLASLGEVYQRIYSSQKAAAVHHTSRDGLELSVLELRPYMSPDLQMEIQVEIKKDGKPFSQQRPYIILTLPDNVQQRLQFQPTDQNGITTLQLPQIPAPNATIIPYKLCLEFPGIEQVCVEDHFLIFSLD